MHDDVCWKASTQLSRSQSRSVTMIRFSSAVILSGTPECHHRSIEGNSSQCRAGLRPYDRWRRARQGLVGLYENLSAPRSYSPTDLNTFSLIRSGVVPNVVH